MLDSRAIRDQAMEDLLGDADVAEREVCQAGERRRAPAGPEGTVLEVQQAETAEAECGSRHLEVVGARGEAEDEFLERIEDRKGEPIVVAADAGGVEEGSECKTAGGAPVSSEDLGDDM